MPIADKVYVRDPTRTALRRRGIAQTIPEGADRVTRRAQEAATADDHRPSANRLPPSKRLGTPFQPAPRWRGSATRYAKCAALYCSSLLLIAALIWLDP
jgi:hypothetical protein